MGVRQLSAVCRRWLFLFGTSRQN